MYWFTLRQFDLSFGQQLLGMALLKISLDKIIVSFAVGFLKHLWIIWLIVTGMASGLTLRMTLNNLPVVPSLGITLATWELWVHPLMIILHLLGRFWLSLCETVNVIAGIVVKWRTVLVWWDLVQVPPSHWEVIWAHFSWKDLRVDGVLRGLHVRMITTWLDPVMRRTLHLLILVPMSYGCMLNDLLRRALPKLLLLILNHGWVKQMSKAHIWPLIIDLGSRVLLNLLSVVVVCLCWVWLLLFAFLYEEFVV